MLAYLGLDIGRKGFDAVLLREDRSLHKVFSNDEAGFTALQTWLETLKTKPAELHACMEATGGYGDDLALFLHGQSIRVSIVNPLQIKAFGQSELVRTKSDKVDAGVIARFCRSHGPAAWAPLSPVSRDLRELVRRCAALKAMRVQELQRRSQGCASTVVRASIDRGIAGLDQEINLLTQAVAKLIAADEALHKAHRLLTSINGIGDQVAAVLLAEIPDFKAFPHNKNITAFVGLNPQERTSGTSVRGRPHISKVGNARLRAILYMAALSARRHNPILKAFADRLALAKKSPKIILVAVARKLLVIAYGVMKTQKPFKPA